MTEEKALTDKYGKANHFRTPDHYFDELPQRIMAKIPHREARRRRWQWAAAAVITGCVATSGLALLHHRNTETETALHDTQFIEDALNYSMIDNSEIATYLTEAEYQ